MVNMEGPKAYQPAWVLQFHSQHIGLKIRTWLCNPEPGVAVVTAPWARAHDHICFSLLALLSRVETEELGWGGRVAES